MNFYTESMGPKYGSNRRRIRTSLIVLGIALIFLYFDSWYFAPTSPLARLPYCVPEIFVEPHSEINSQDGRVSAIFATEPRTNTDAGNAYAVLQFFEDGTFNFYTVFDLYAPFVNVHRLNSWIAWFETPSFSWDSIPKNSDNIRFEWDEGTKFHVSPPEKGVYSIRQGELSIEWNADQKWSSYQVDEIWRGKLLDKQLIMNVLLPSGLEIEEIYFYMNYDTCPLDEP